LRKIEVVAGLNLRFSGRDAEFDQGVEVGLVLAGMAAGQRRIERQVASDTLEQLRMLAQKLGYRLSRAEIRNDEASVLLEPVTERPALRLIG
jgi:hypothetical protein